MKIYNCTQGSPQWVEIKLGKVSASHFGDVLNQKTGRRTYMFKLLAERLSGEPALSYSNKAMEDGIENEPEARAYYEALYGEVRQVGFVEMNDYIGCSPDGLVGEDGGLEIKCPYPSTHLRYIVEDKLPAVYKPQVQGLLWIAELEWTDFVSFAPQVKQRPFWKLRVFRDTRYIKTLSDAVSIFVKEMLELEDKITGKGLDF